MSHSDKLIQFSAMTVDIFPRNIKKMCFILYDYFEITIDISVTCGKHCFLGERLIVHNGKLGKFDVLHPRDRPRTPSLPVELNVISGVSICTSTCHRNNSAYMGYLQTLIKRFENTLTFLYLHSDKCWSKLLIVCIQIVNNKTRLVK